MAAERPRERCSHSQTSLVAYNVRAWTTHGLISLINSRDFRFSYDCFQELNLGLVATGQPSRNMETMAPTVSERHWSWRNFLTIFIVSFGLLAYGYPASIIGTTLGQPSFLLYMKLLDPSTLELTDNADQLIGAMSGIFQESILPYYQMSLRLIYSVQAGAIFGIFGTSWVMEKWGRKAGILFCGTLSIISGTLLTASQNVGMFITFRFFAGAGSYGFFAVSM